MNKDKKTATPVIPDSEDVTKAVMGKTIEQAAALIVRCRSDKRRQYRRWLERQLEKMADELKCSLDYSRMMYQVGTLERNNTQQKKLAKEIDNLDKADVRRIHSRYYKAFLDKMEATNRRR